MAGRKTRTRWLVCGVVHLGLLTGGCRSVLNPVQPVSPPLEERCRSVSQTCGAHVHIIVINGFDPVRITNAVGLAEYLETLGFPNVHYTTMWGSPRYLDRIVSIKAADPSARIVIIGYSMGVCFARKLAQRAKEHEIVVDLLIYLDAFTINHRPEHDEHDAVRIVNLITEPRLGIFRSDALPGVCNYQFLGVRHVRVPTDSRVLERVIQELADLEDPAPSK